MANSKAGEHVLIVLPQVEKRPRRVLERVAAELREKGSAATTISADQFGTSDLVKFPPRSGSAQGRMHKYAILVSLWQTVIIPFLIRLLRV